MYLARRDGLGLPQQSRDAFRLLAEVGRLDPDLGRAMERMVGFPRGSLRLRNVAVHDCQALNLPVVRAIIERHLGEFEALAAHALRGTGGSADSPPRVPLNRPGSKNRARRAALPAPVPSPVVPLVLLANRAPVRPTAEGWAPALGGLATALLPVLEARGGAWVAMREPGDDAPLDQPFPDDAPRLAIRRVPLSDEEFEAYYQGMANRVLWPLAHYLVEHVEPERAFWQAYRAVNRRFVEAALTAAGSDPRATFWVHDYHLMLVPEGIRQGRSEARIGFFWHVPWPAEEVFRILPSARALVRGVLGADLVGFHTAGYAENFRHAARDLLGAPIVGDDVEWEGRRVRVEAHPIGVDVAAFEALGAGGALARDVEAVRAGAGVEKLIVGVDRLDYTKGLLLRLDAFERFLETYPECKGRVTLFQVATPSRTGIPAYDRLKRDVEQTVGRINGLYAEGAWVPVRYRYRAYTPAELAVLYRAADVMLVTPLRDGMNLVAHEYAAVEDATGALVLSELTGAADYLDGAVLVNPYDTDGLARTLRAVLDMSDDERRHRMARLKASVARLDVHGWAERFLSALDEGPPPEGGVSGDGAPAARIEV